MRMFILVNSAFLSIFMQSFKFMAKCLISLDVNRRNHYF